LQQPDETLERPCPVGGLEHHGPPRHSFGRIEIPAGQGSRRLAEEAFRLLFDPEEH